MRFLNFTLAKIHQIGTFVALGSYTFLSLSFNFQKDTNQLTLSQVQKVNVKGKDGEMRQETVIVPGKKVIL